ncbi:ubiquitin carboxyl-terminal hydrolase 37-like isoform X2 [Mizuhopecten yessoensis]|uniref:ubiquitin carboxyl-terminal hydrolase 37-like isoform X2 n=1 Tax=Mizuhopecten yessoensis TaxID=6573 RepID=UPI000B45BFE1|nr:ubiquitin carboxyl-terminal hydrolase 37-like isoform X2 [Mizuhopecten yessoensis]
MVMKWDISKKYACHGQVKQRGITTGSGKWKTGNVCVHFVNGKWKLEVFYCTAPNKSVTSTEVNNTNIEGVICKNQLVITLRNKTEASAIQFRPESSATQYTKPMSVLDQLIKDICAGKSAPESHQSPSVVCVTGWQQNGTKTPSKQGPAKDSSFTSVKKKSEEVSLFEDTDDENEFKENQNRGQVSKDKSQKYLQNGMEKARNHLQQIETSGFYSSSSATPRSYGAYSLSSNLKRTPGMMPDPTPPKRPRLSDSINYTWNKSNITTTTTPGSNQLPTQPKSLQGFSNLGNTCYMNAILQSLFCLDTFSNDLLFSNTRVMKTLHSQSLYSALYKLLRSRSKTLPEHVRRDMLRNVKSAISTTAKRFSGYQQHDAHEFLGQVLDQLKEEVTKVSSSTPSPHREGSDGDTQYTNPTVQNFEMEVLHSITCLNCREVVTKAEQFNDLSVDMPRRRKNGDPSSIQNALDLFFRSEAIEYTCEKCGSNKSEVSHKFSRLPRVLVLHLKRYNFDQSIINTKTAQSISITRFLSLEGHCEENTYPPYPALLNSPEQYKTPDKSLTSAESVPRRCLQLGESFRFKKTRPVEEDEKEDVSTSTPYKKAKIFDLGEDHNIKADMPLLIEDRPDEEEDKDLARALELSLQEANDRTQNYVDETKESELQKVLEMSRVEIDKSTQFDHDYGKTIQNMSEEEQMRLAIEQSLMETSHVSRTDFTQEIEPINTEHTDEAIDDTQVDKPICQTTTDNIVCRTTSVKKPTEDASSQTAQSCVKKEKTTRTSLSSGKPLQKSPLCVRKLGNGQENTSSDFPVKGRVSEAMLDVIAEERDTESVGPDSDLSLPEKQRDDSQEFSVSGDKCIDLTSPDPCVSDSSSKFLPVNERITTKSTKTCLFGKEDLSKPDSPWNALGEKRIRSELENSTEDLDEKQTKSTIDKMSENVADINTAIDLEYQCTEVKTDGSKPDNSRLCGVQDDDTGHSAISRLDQGSDKPEGDAQVSNGDQEFASLLCEDEDDFQLMLLEDKENALPEHRPVQTQSEEDTQPYPDLPVVENEKGDLPYSYKLVSIVNHQGSTSVAGHYVTDVYDLKKGAWFSCDDSNVTKSTEAEVRSKRERSGYIFFYLSKEIYEDLKDDYAVKNRNRKQ